MYQADLTSTYQYERRVLKLLQWGEPTRPWRLKCPNHLAHLDALDAAFPDARFVMTHRDPTEVIVSVADVYSEVARIFGQDVDLHYLGSMNVEQWSTAMERAIAFRDAGNDDRFWDMDFRAMQRDPIAEVHRLYDWLGEPVTEAFESGMRRWWKDKAESREANVHPDPAEFGLDLEQVRPRFAYNEGYIYQEGRMFPARATRIPWLRRLIGEGDDVSIELESELGVTRIEGSTLLTTYRIMGRSDGLPVDFNLQQGGARYEWDGMTTYGMIERSTTSDQLAPE